MKTFYITIQNTSGTPYDFEVEASSPEDVMGQVRALSAGLRMGLARIEPPAHAGGAWTTPIDSFTLEALSTSKTRGREYIVLSEWISP